MAINSAEWATIRQEITEVQEHRCQWCRAPDGATVYRVNPLPDKPKVYLLPDTRQIFDASTGKALGFYPADKKLPGGVYKRIVLDLAYLDHDVTNEGEPGNRPNVACLCQACQSAHSGALRERIAADAANRKKVEEARRIEAARIAEFGPMLFPAFEPTNFLNSAKR